MTKNPDFEQFARENNFIVDGNKDDNNKEGGSKEEYNNDGGYFSDDELPADETGEVTDEWLLSHLMDDTSSVASDKSSRLSRKKSPTDDVEGSGGIFYGANKDIGTTNYRVNAPLCQRELSRITMKSMEKADPEENEEMDEEVDFGFVVDDDVVPTVEDDVEPAQHPSPLLLTNSFGDAVHTNMCKETKSSGDEPPYNRWLKLINEHRAKKKTPLQLTEILRAWVDTDYPIMYCTVPFTNLTMTATGSHVS